MIIVSTLAQWANEMGISHETLERRLIDCGVEIVSNKAITFQMILKVIEYNKECPQDRLATAKAIEKERENKEAMGELCAFADVANLINQLLILPLQGGFDHAPTEIDRQWIEKVIKPLLLQKIKWEKKP